jgi:serine/threonine protein kinase/Flp pilus assembly protein TadD
MGTVYEAVQENPRRRVAVKMMKLGITSPSALRRFEFESQTLARLQHQGIAQVFEAGTHDDGSGGVPYFIMEYVSSAKSITEYADKKQLGTRDRLALFSKVCDAVQHGHMKGIVHRDLKPTNILVDVKGMPKIIDFGVARSTDSDLAVTTLQTNVGAFIGTLQYMSPEQCEIDPQDIDTRSDVYALGVILYELLTGKPPYDVKKAAIHEAVQIIREAEPTRLSTIERHLAGDIETISLKALAKEREDRYQSAGALRDDIGRYLVDEPISAKPPSVWAQAKRFARRNQAAAIAAVCVFAVLIGAVIVSSTFAIRSEKARIETQELVDASKAYLENMINTEHMQLMYNTMGTEKIVDILDYAVEQAKKGFSKDTQQQRMLFSVLDRIAINYGLMGMEDKAADLMQGPIQDSRDVLGRLDPDTLRMISNMGYHLIKEDTYDEAEALLDEALVGQHDVLGDNHRDTLRTLSYKGILRNMQEKYVEAEELLVDTIKRQRKFLGNKDPDTLRSIRQLGNLCMRQDRYDEAEGYYREAVVGNTEVLGKEDPRTKGTVLNLAYLLVRHGYQLDTDGHEFLSKIKYTEAILLFNEVVDLVWDDDATQLSILAKISLDFVDDLDNTDMSTIALRPAKRAYELSSYKNADILNILGRVHLMRDEFVEAEKHFREALVGHRELLGNEDPDTLRSINNLGVALAEQEKFVEAVEYFREVWEIHQRVLGNEDRHTLRSIKNLSDVLREMGNLFQSQGKYNEALEKYTEAMNLSWDNDSLLNSIVWNVTTQTDKEFFAIAKDEALRAAKRACELSIYEDAIMLNTLAHVHFERGEFEDAVHWEEKAVNLDQEDARLPQALTKFKAALNEAAE